MTERIICYDRRPIAMELPGDTACGAPVYCPAPNDTMDNSGSSGQAIANSERRSPPLPIDVDGFYPEQAMAHNHTEHVQEEIHHQAAHGGHGEANKWITAAALTAAILAAFAAVSASLATKHLTESTLKRIAANDQWNYYQAKSIKLSIIADRDMNYALQDPAKIPPVVTKQHEEDLSKKAEYATKPEDEKDPMKPQGMKGIQKLADELESVSSVHLRTHETYEMSATMFHIAIAVVAIAVVAKRKEFWYMSMVGGLVGLYFFASAYANAPAHEGGHHEATAEHAAPGHSAAPGATHEGTPHEAAAHETAPAGEAHH
jgi:hypothetical protein